MVLRAASKSLPWVPRALPPAVRNSIRPFSVLDRPPPNYEGHVPLTLIEKGALAVGSAITSLFNPRRSGRHSTARGGLDSPTRALTFPVQI